MFGEKGENQQASSGFLGEEGIWANGSFDKKRGRHDNVERMELRGLGKRFGFWLWLAPPWVGVGGKPAAASSTLRLAQGHPQPLGRR